MKYYIYHFENRELEVPGVYQDGNPQTALHKEPHWIIIYDRDFAETMRKLSEDWAVMLLGPKVGFPYYSIFLDSKKWKFKQR